MSDASRLSGPTFFKLAWRLDSYQGAVLAAAMREAEMADGTQEGSQQAPQYEASQLEVLDDHVLTAEELQRQFPPAPTIGQDVGMFEVTACA